MITNLLALFRILLILEFSRSLNMLTPKSIRPMSRLKFIWSRDIITPLTTTLKLTFTLLLQFKLLLRRDCSMILRRKMNTMIITLTSTKTATTMFTKKPSKLRPWLNLNSRLLPFLKITTKVMRTGSRLATVSANTEEEADLVVEEDADLAVKKVMSTVVMANINVTSVTKRRVKAKPLKVRRPRNKKVKTAVSAEDVASVDPAVVVPRIARRAKRRKASKLRMVRDHIVEEVEDVAIAEMAKAEVSPEVSTEVSKEVSPEVSPEVSTEVSKEVSTEVNTEANAVPEVKATVEKTPELRSRLLRVKANEELTSRFD